MTVYGHDLFRFQSHICPFGIGTDHIFIAQVICQTLRPGPGSRKDHYLIALGTHLL